MRFGKKAGCHQRPDRSFFWGNWQYPLCARCTGILFGQAAGLVMYLSGVRLSWTVDLLLLLIMLTDWLVQFTGKKESTNLRRFITGSGAGIAQTDILMRIIFFCISAFSYLKNMVWSA